MWQPRSEQLKDLEFVFNRFDKDGCHSLSLWQFHFAHKAALGFPPHNEELKRIFGAEAVAGSRWCTDLTRANDIASHMSCSFAVSRLSFDEFVSEIRRVEEDPKRSPAGSVAWDIFDEFDTGGKGYISCDDWQKAVHELFPEMEYNRIRNLFHRLDEKRFGRVLFGDFEALLMAASSQHSPTDLQQ